MLQHISMASSWLLHSLMGYERTGVKVECGYFGTVFPITELKISCYENWTITKLLQCSFLFVRKSSHHNADRAV
jgi:hypothetical protein